MRYAVLIVNFNTASFVAKAVSSILRCATTDDILICVVDNSSTEADRALLRQVAGPKVRVAELDHNGGFAVGYNAAARLAQDVFRPEFLVIMNPDVELVASGSIEALINRVKKEGADVVGAQPLIHGFRLPGNAAEQPAIRRVPNAWDLVITESIVLRYVFRRRYRRFLMADAKPYGEHTRFLVPSGAFFLIRAQDFSEIGGFDEGTFLYGEEFILGKKLQQRSRYFLFDPSITVLHYQGAATGFERWRPSRQMYNFRRDSQMYYVRKYLDGSSLQQSCLWAAVEIGYLIRITLWALREIRWLVAKIIRASETA